jgi:hypothetical protein
MNEEEIDRLFRSVLEHSRENSPAVMEIFSVLVKTTLKYRDHLLSSLGVIVTVEDVRKSLDWLVPALSSGVLPRTDQMIPLNLLKLWLDELKRIGKADIYLT